MDKTEAVEAIIRAVEQWCDAQVPERVRKEIEEIVHSAATVSKKS